MTAPKSNKWRAIVQASQAKKYVLPEGWTSKTKMAEMLDCREDNVKDVLRDALKDGTVEVNVFRVFSKELGKVIQVTAYREAGK